VNIQPSIQHGFSAELSAQENIQLQHCIEAFYKFYFLLGKENIESDIIKIRAQNKPLSTPCSVHFSIHTSTRI
jgi:hypothetical protein